MENNRRAIIFANGDSKSSNFLSDEIRENDILIAADGGTQQLMKLGLLPHVVIGDLDSIQPELLNKLRMNEVMILNFPSRKDETDLELALQYTNQLGIKNIHIYNALGARWDMTVSNVLLLCSAKFKNMNIHIMDGFQEISLIHGETTQMISGYAGDILSLIPIGGNAEGITSSGLEYQLADDSLELGSPRGVSNILLEDNAKIYLKKGLLLCIHIRHAKDALDQVLTEPGNSLPSQTNIESTKE